MAYRLLVRNPNYKLNDFSLKGGAPYFVEWFANSWDELDRGRVNQAVYEETYNVKIFYNGPMNSIKEVEFPSEADAIMFVLRWS